MRELGLACDCVVAITDVVVVGTSCGMCVVSRCSTIGLGVV